MPLVKELHQELRLVLDLESMELCRHRQMKVVELPMRLQSELESHWR
jgi:hypothetical protein